jgi:hypothetical protein
VDSHTIANMKERVAKCRQLAAFTTDEHVATILLQMAEEAEADLKRMADQGQKSQQEITITVNSEPDA